MSRNELGRLDAATVREIARLLEERVRAVEVYGVGGCPTCHDAELRAAIAKLNELASAAAERG